MSIKVTLTEKEILDTPNDAMLGELTRNKYWQARRDHEGPQYDDEHFAVVIGDDGLVKSIIRPYRCSICGGDTSEIEYDYLVGYDHLGCVLKEENEKPDNFDKCVICGKETPYLRSTHIDLREGYVEGGGQGCYQPNICGK
jgi:DNA-directed RNA polymerase subunit RPC12/RpoP